MSARSSFREKASFWRILIAEQFRQFFAIPFKVVFLAFIVFFQASSWITHTPWMGTVAAIVFWYLIINIVVNVTRVIMVRYYLRRKQLPSGHKDNFTTGLKRLSTLLSHVVFFFVLLYLLGIQITQFFTSISLVAVALVLLFREYLANFISGIVALFTDDIQLGDYIEVSGFKGKVVDITLLHVELQTDAGDITYIPNATVSAKEVTNFSKRDNKVVTAEFTIPKSVLKHKDKIEGDVRSRLQEVFGDVVSHDKVRFLSEKVDKDSVLFSVKIPFSRYTRDRDRDAKQVVATVVIPVLAKAK